MQGNKKEIERHIVLVAPEVHWNTGNIGRTCLGANASLHLIKPLGFSIESREVKRAGLDYWNEVDLHVWEDFRNFTEEMKAERSEIALFSKSGGKTFRELPEISRLFLLFGSETKGLPQPLVEKYNDSVYYIPVSDKIRCLNLSTSVGIALYESLKTAKEWHSWDCAKK